MLRFSWRAYPKITLQRYDLKFAFFRYFGSLRLDGWGFRFGFGSGQGRKQNNDAKLYFF